MCVAGCDLTTSVVSVLQGVIQQLATAYLHQLSAIAGSLITCGPVLGWLELDNRGHRLIVTDDSDINTPAVAAAYVVKRYVAQASDEISFEVSAPATPFCLLLSAPYSLFDALRLRQYIFSVATPYCWWYALLLVIRLTASATP